MEAFLSQNENLIANLITTPKNRQLILGVLFFFLAIFTSVTVHAEEQKKPKDERYHLAQEAYQVDIDAAGHTKLTINLTYEAENLSKITYTLPVSSQYLSHYRVGVKDSKGHVVSQLSERASGLVGSYQVKQEDGMAQVEITYPLVDEEATFYIECSLANAVTRYQDVALWTHTLVPQTQEDGQDITIEFRLPGQIYQVDDFRLWLQGQEPTKKDLEQFEGRSRLHMTIPYSSYMGSKLDFHAIFPPSMVPNNEEVVEVDRENTIVSHEATLHQAVVEREAKARNSHLRNTVLMVAVPILGTIVLFTICWRKRCQPTGKDCQTSNESIYPPQEIEACMVNAVVFQQKPAAKDLAALLLEMGRKGYIKLTPIATVKRGLNHTRSGYTLLIERGNQTEQGPFLLAHEKPIYQLLFEGSQKAITFEEMLSQLKVNRTYRKDKEELWHKFCDAVEVYSVIKRQQRKNTKPILLANIGIWFILSVLLMVWLVNYSMGHQWAFSLRITLPLVIINLIGLLAMFVWVNINSFAGQGQMDARNHWTAFATNLSQTNRNALMEKGSLQEWEKNLAYAMALNAHQTIQQSFTHQFTREDLMKGSRSTHGDLLKVHGSLANILLPAMSELVEALTSRKKW